MKRALALLLLLPALAACGEEDVSTARPRSTPELTLPGGDVTPDDAAATQGTTETGTTGTTPEATTGTDAAPTAPEDTTGTEAAPTAETDGPPAAQGATGASELEGFCQENPGAC